MLQPLWPWQDQWECQLGGAESIEFIPRLLQRKSIGGDRSNRLSSVIDPSGRIVESFLLPGVVKCFMVGVKRPAALYDSHGELLKLSGMPRDVLTNKWMQFFEMINQDRPNHIYSLNECLFRIAFVKIASSNNCLIHSKFRTLEIIHIHVQKWVNHLIFETAVYAQNLHLKKIFNYET